MRSNVFAASGVAVSAYPWIQLDHYIRPFEVSYHVLKTGTGDVTYAVEGTLSNLEEGGVGVAVVSAKVFQIVSGKTADFQSSIAAPVVAMRLNTSAVSGAANLSFITLQSGP